MYRERLDIFRAPSACPYHPEPFLVLGQRTCPIDYFRSKTHVFGWFHAIYSMHPTRCGNWYRGSFDWPFQNSRTLDILLERFQCAPLGPKLIFWVFSDHFDALKCPFGFARHTLGLKLMFTILLLASMQFYITCDNS